MKTKFLSGLIIFFSLWLPANAQSTPEKAMEMLFDAARTKNYSSVANLCDPQDESDGDVKRICGIASADSKTKKEFRKAFQSARITGPGEYKTVQGIEICVLPFTFGPAGSPESEKMTLVKRGENWYLLSF